MMTLLSIRTSWILFSVLLNLDVVTPVALPLDFLSLANFGLTLLLPSEPDDEVTIQDTMLEISSKIYDLEKATKTSEKTIINEMGYQIKYNEAIRSYIQTTSFIDNLYELFQSYAAEGFVEVDTLQDFADTCIAHGDNGLSTKLNILHELITPRSNMVTGLLQLLFEHHQTEGNGAKRCGKTISLQQEIYGYYTEISMYLVKGYTMKFHAYNILKKLHSRQYEKERKLTTSLYERAMDDTAESTLWVMQDAPRDIRSCDPKIHEEGKTYIELKWLFNAIALNEVYLNEGASCSSTCNDYKSTIFHPYPPAPLQKLDSCQGNLHDCFYQNSELYCPTTKSSRRYNGFIAFGSSGTTVGSRGELECNRKQSFDWKFINIYNSLFYRCDVCACYCDDYTSNATVRTFSLKAVRSSISRNKIITGVRFVERNRVIYIQIQEGKLYPNGVMPASKIKWKPINDSIPITASDWPHYHFQVGYDRKSINLDTLYAPADHVLTGIRLSAKGSNLGLEIKTNQVNYTEGIVYEGKPNWITVDEKIREEITMDAPDIPTYAIDNIVDTRKNTYVNFRMTDWDKDAAQTAVPFIDAQPVVSDPPQPLTGAGLYYRGQTGYGGFIGLKLLAFDYSLLINLGKNLRNRRKQDTSQSGSEVEQEDGTGNVGFIELDSEASDHTQSKRKHRKKSSKRNKNINKLLKQRLRKKVVGK